MLANGRVQGCCLVALKFCRLERWNTSYGEDPSLVSESPPKLRPNLNAGNGRGQMNTVKENIIIARFYIACFYKPHYISYFQCFSFLSLLPLFACHCGLAKSDNNCPMDSWSADRQGWWLHSKPKLNTAITSVVALRVLLYLDTRWLAALYVC